MDKRIALITGITGQDGSYLAEFLLEKDYEVHGIIRRSSSRNTNRIDHIYENPNLHLHYGDITDSLTLMNVLKKQAPSEIYNLAAQSHVKVSFDTPEYTAHVDALGTLKLLESVRLLNMEKTTKIYQASTSELYGLVQETPQKETTPFYPRSPYGVAKLYAYWIVKNYRESYNMFACSGILFNHESPRRGFNFVTKKIVNGLEAVSAGREKCLTLGNLTALRDWGHAKDYVEAMWRILQQDTPDDYVIATGITTTVRDFVRMAFEEVGVTLEFKGEGVHETGIVAKCDNPAYQLEVGSTVVAVDPEYFRPTEVELLIGDATKAKTKLNWTPKYDLPALVKEMVASDLL